METIITEQNNSFSTDNESRYVNKSNKYESCTKDLYKKIKFDYSYNTSNEEGSLEYESESEEDYEYDEFDFSVTEMKKAKTIEKERYLIYKYSIHGDSSDLPKEKVLWKDKTSYKLNEKIKKLNHDIVTYEPVKEMILDLNPYQHLVSEFEATRIKLKLVSRPSQFSTIKAKVDSEAESFLMDLRRDDGEYIIIYPGKHTQIEVININNEFHQLLLSVKEPERKLKVVKQVFNKKLGKRIDRVINNITKAEERLFLIGKDEGHMFISQMKESVATVIQAHKSLKPSALKKWDKKYYKRQGEWFFVPKPNMRRPYFITSFNTGLVVGTGRPHMAHGVIDIVINYMLGDQSLILIIRL
jgi:hypothetical protein